MADKVHDYSTTAASNEGEMPENQPPSTANDGVRSIQAHIAAFRNELTTNVTVGGTANAITLTYSPANTSIADKQTFAFIAASDTTTTTPTIAVDGLTARTIVRDSYGTALLVNDIKQYRTHYVRYDLANTRYVLLNPHVSTHYQTDSISQDAFGNAVVGQAELKTATAQQSVSVSLGSYGEIALTGGLYSLNVFTSSGPYGSDYLSQVPYRSASYVTSVEFRNQSGGSITGYCNSRYVQASPPYNYGAGDVPLFILAMLDRSTRQVLATSIAEDPPWAYHGSHDLHPVNGKLKRHFGLWGGNINTRMRNPAQRDELFDAMRRYKASIDRATPDAIRERQIALSHTFTMAEKMIDMNQVPHLFHGYDPARHVVVMVDPISTFNIDMAAYHNLTVGEEDAESVTSLLINGDIILGTENIGAPIQRGVIPVTGRFR